MVIPEILISLGFGKRSLTFQDFEKACGIMKFLYFLVDDKYIEEGMSFPRNRHGRKYRIIILRRSLFELSLAEVAWHEFGHAYFEHYGIRLFVAGSEDRVERQADDFALCCLIPQLWLTTRTREEIMEENFAIEQIDRRMQVFESTGV